MNWGDFATWAGVVVAVVLGIFATRYSRKANLLAQKTAAMQAERWYVGWTASWHAAGALLVLHQSGGDPALDVRVTISGDGIHATATQDSVLPNTDTVVSVGDVHLRRADFGRNVESVNDAGVIYVAVYAEKVHVRIDWRTGLGRPDRQDLEVTVN